MQCNIDARGKAVRLIAGAVVEAIGWLLVVSAFVDLIQNRWAIGLGIAAIVMGGFMVFQGLAGWCAIRAMGFRTRV